MCDRYFEYGKKYEIKREHINGISAKYISKVGNTFIYLGPAKKHKCELIIKAGKTKKYNMYYKISAYVLRNWCKEI